MPARKGSSEEQEKLYRIYYRHPEFHRPDTRDADGEFVRLSLSKGEAAKLESFLSGVRDNLGRHEYIGMTEWSPCGALLNGTIPCPNQFGAGHEGPHMVWED